MNFGVESENFAIFFFKIEDCLVIEFLKSGNFFFLYLNFENIHSKILSVILIKNEIFAIFSNFLLKTRDFSVIQFLFSKFINEK